MDISGALREAYEASGWTFVDLAFHGGVSVTTARSWVFEGTLPRADAHEKLKAHLPGYAERLSGRAVA